MSKVLKRLVLVVTVMACSGARSEQAIALRSADSDNVTSSEQLAREIGNSVVVGVIDGLLIGTGAAMLKKYAGCESIVAFLGSHLLIGRVCDGVVRYRGHTIPIAYHSSLARTVSLLLSVLVINKLPYYL